MMRDKSETSGAQNTRQLFCSQVAVEEENR
jgi:hypothetical protein